MGKSRIRRQSFEKSSEIQHREKIPSQKPFVSEMIKLALKLFGKYRSQKASMEGMIKASLCRQKSGARVSEAARYSLS